MPIEMSPEIDQLAEALKKFQSKVVTVERTVTNPFFRSKYADLASIMLESQPILTECDLTVSQFPDNLDGQAALTTILIHVSGQFVKATVPLPVAKITTVTKKEKTPKKPDDVTITSEGYDPQEFGRAVTYMRRYGYSAVLQIVIDEDNDGNKLQHQTEASTPTPPEPVPSNPETITKIKTIWKENGGTVPQLDTWVRKNGSNNNLPLEELPGDRQLALLAVLENKKAEREAKATANLTTVAGANTAESKGTAPAEETPKTEVNQSTANVAESPTVPHTSR